MNPSPPEATADYLSSGMSELDCLSDSDWLDIPSGHASEDNDSVESSSRPLSRRSSFSMGSSKDGEVDAWEGFAYNDNDDVAAPGLASGMYPHLPLARAGSTDLQRIPLGLIPDIETESDRAEDERVKEALDQSLVGTLNASRSSATNGPLHSSGQTASPNSTHDLRLSFPDPLTSSRDELVRSYEDVSPLDVASPGPPAIQEREGSDNLTSPDHLPLNPVAPSVPAATIADRTEEAHAVLPTPQSTDRVDLQIHIYGSSTEYKWSFVQDLLEKVADACGQFLSTPLDPDGGPRQLAILESDDEDSKGLFRIVKIFDRTDDKNYVPVVDIPDCPSLGVVFLPSIRLPSLSLHSLYLPVFARNDILDVAYSNSIQAMRTAAEDDWELLSIPTEKVFPIRDFITSQDGIRSADSCEIREAMKAVMTGTSKKVIKPGSEQSASINRVTIFALVSLIVGFACNTSFHSSNIPTKAANLTATNNTWVALSPTPNKSNSISHFNHPRTQPVTLRDMALSVYNPGTSSLVLTPVEVDAVPPTSPHSAAPQCTQCVSAVLSDKPMTQAIIVVPPPASASVTQEDECPLSASPLPTEIPVIELPAAEVKPSESDSDDNVGHIPKLETTLSLRFVDSVSEALGVTAKTVLKALNDDANEIENFGLDELMESLRAQTDEIIKQSKGKARAIGDQVQVIQGTLQTRNERARVRAKELRRRGEEFLYAASEHLRERTEIAKKRAQRMRRVVEESEAWHAYRRSLEDLDDIEAADDDGRVYWGCPKTRRGLDGHGLRTISLTCE